MFKVHLKLVSLITDISLETPLTIKIRKEHWHFALVDKVNSPVLDVERSFELNEEEGVDSTFQIQLITKISQKKAKLIGLATIDVKEYPMETKKSDRVRMGSHAWLQIQLNYSYVPRKESQSLFEDAQLQKLQTADVLLDQKDKNVLLSSEIIRLTQLHSQAQKEYKDLQQENRRLKQIRTTSEKQFYSKQLTLQQQHQKLSYNLHQANYSLTALINLIYDHGDMELINDLDDVLCQRKSQSSKYSKQSKQSQEGSSKDRNYDMLKI